MRKYILLLLLNSLLLTAAAQTGGDKIFRFLDLPVSARASALGGKLFSVRDKQPALAIQNPSMLHPSMSMGTAFNMVDYFSNAVYGHLNYIQDFTKVGTFNFAFNFASYGSFQGYDIYGNETAKFTAGDYAVIAGYGKEFIDSTFSMGMNVKMIFSKYETYFSAGLGVDFAASYYSHPNNLSLTLLISNLGSQFNAYTYTREKMPFEIQLSLSQRLKHLPVRYVITLHHLQKWNLSYDDPTDPYASIDAISGEVIQNGAGRRFANNFFRHIVFGLEILPMKYFSIQLSYNYNVRQEMRSYEKPGVVGFAYGAGLHLYNFDLYYARSHNNLASVPNHFTLSTNIGSLLKKKKSPNQN
ncbi:MAG: type IX secretion system protein PorQ [Bacteroidales bacterium]|jgi:hypothetical protein|nr:type IX secretion system protein PorQ [Bacteroidales bacterium]